MFDHIGLRVMDLETSIRFYIAALKGLDYMLCSQDESCAGFGPKDSPELWLYSGQRNSNVGVHVAFRATTRSAVDAFYLKGLKSGGRDNGAPGLRKDYGSNYYAAFLLDPDGNNIEAVCMS